MPKRATTFLITLTILLTAAVLLILGSPILVKPLVSDPYIPAGTPITWAGLVALPLSIYLGNKTLRRPSGRFMGALAILLQICLLLAILWAPVSYFLAGNFSNSFSTKEVFRGGQLAMRWFWRYTYFLVIFPLSILLVHVLVKQFKGSAAE